MSNDKSIQTTIANLLERKARTGLVFSDRLLDAVVGIMEYASALERRVAALERECAAVGSQPPRTAFGWGDSSGVGSDTRRRVDPVGEA